MCVAVAFAHHRSHENVREECILPRMASASACQDADPGFFNARRASRPGFPCAVPLAAKGGWVALRPEIASAGKLGLCGNRRNRREPARVTAMCRGDVSKTPEISKPVRGRPVIDRAKQSLATVQGKHRPPY